MRSEHWDSLVRALIAAIVILITWELTRKPWDIAEQWEAVFLMVIAYYFKDRPQAEKLGNEVFTSQDAARVVHGEIIAQFIMAMLLLTSTAALFSLPSNGALRDTIAGAWIGGVTLAIAFYFKDVAQGATTTLHNHFRSFLAIGVGAATVVIFTARITYDSATKTPLPMQWVALAFIMISFYFKERGTVEPSATSKARTEARAAAAATTT